MFEAVRRETAREKSSSERTRALSRATQAAVAPLSVTVKLGLRMTVRMFLLLMTNAARQPGLAPFWVMSVSLYICIWIWICIWICICICIWISIVSVLYLRLLSAWICRHVFSAIATFQTTRLSARSW